MQLNPDEKILLEIKKFFSGGVFFLMRKEDIWSFKNFGGIHIYLTNRRIVVYSRVFLKIPLLNEIKILEILLPDILYFGKDKIFWRRIRLGYKENNKEKEILLVLNKKDRETLIEELNKLKKDLQS